MSKELFDTVRKIFATSRDKRKSIRSRDYLLRGGILKCGCCSYAMIYDDSCLNTVYRCSHSHGDPNTEYYKLKVSAPELDEAVWTLIRKQAEIILSSNDISDLWKTSEIAQNILEYEKQITLCVEQQQRTYE